MSGRKDTYAAQNLIDLRLMEGRRVREGGQPLWVAFIEDSVYGASDNHKAGNPSFWRSTDLDAESESAVSIRLYRNVPDDLAQDLINHGTRKQTFSDGYEAARALRGLSSKVVWSNE